MHVEHLAITGSDEPLVERIEGETVAREPLGERGIGHALERHDEAGQRRQQGQADSDRSHQLVAV
jgi:hypothetical protein